MKRLSLLVALVGFGVCTAAPALAQWEAAEGIDWLPFQEAVAEAERTGKKVMIDAYSPRCGWCKKLHEEVYTDDAIQSYVNDNFVMTRLNIDERSDTLRYGGYVLPSSLLAAYWGATSTPTTVFLKSDGEAITGLPGFQKADFFLDVMEYIASDAVFTQSFDAYQEEQGNTEPASGGR
ncbi:MAG: hypothetical protein RhofKO_13550 [Rhodothermales bacterium]